MTESKDTIKTMIEAGVHFGYSKRTAHPSMSQYVCGLKNGVSIFDLEKTQEQLDKATAFLKEAVTGGKVIFCASKNEARGVTRKAADKVHMPYVTTRWIGGTLTNWSEISKRVAKLERMTAERERGDFSKYTKKERLKMDREINKLEKYYSGLLEMKEMPKALIVVDPHEEEVAVQEARNKGIPVIAVSSTDCNVVGIDYVIPGNDSALASIELLINTLADSMVV